MIVEKVKKISPHLVFNLRFLAIEITKVYFALKYAKISKSVYIIIIQQYTHFLLFPAFASYRKVIAFTM